MRVLPQTPANRGNVWSIRPFARIPSIVTKVAPFQDVGQLHICPAHSSFGFPAEILSSRLRVGLRDNGHHLILAGRNRPPHVTAARRRATPRSCAWARTRPRHRLAQKSFHHAYGPATVEPTRYRVANVTSNNVVEGAEVLEIVTHLHSRPFRHPAGYPTDLISVY